MAVDGREVLVLYHKRAYHLHQPHMAGTSCAGIGVQGCRGEAFRPRSTYGEACGGRDVKKSRVPLLAPSGKMVAKTRIRREGRPTSAEPRGASANLGQCAGPFHCALEKNLIPKGIVTRNAFAAVVQSVASVATVFLLYRYLLSTLGVEKIGLWSIVSATASASKLSDLGIAASVSPYVARYQALKRQDTAAGVVETAVLSVGVILGVALIGLYPVLAKLVTFFVPPDALGEALAILPYSLVALWFSVIGAVLQSALDGSLRTDMRALSVVTGNVILLGSAPVLISAKGLSGLALAQVLQACVTVILAWLMARRALRQLHVVPAVWRWGLFKEMLNYGLSMQTLSVFVVLTEPATKLLMGRIGGLSVAGYFEIAYRIVMLVRLVLVSAAQVLVPVFAHEHSTDESRFRSVYSRAYSCVLFASLPTYGALGAMAAVVSEVWVGRYEAQFVEFVVFLVVAYGLNTLGVPAYVAFLGIRRLRWNILGHLLMATVTIAGGLGLGLGVGGVGVVWAHCAGIVAGSAVILLALHREMGIPFSVLRPKGAAAIFFGTACGIMTTVMVHAWLAVELGPWLEALVSMAVFVGVLAPFLWVHPARQQVEGMLRPKQRQGAWQ